MAHKRFKIGSLQDPLLVAVGGVCILIGRVKDAAWSPANILIGLIFILSAGLQLLAELGFLQGLWWWSGWALLVVSLVLMLTVV